MSLTKAFRQVISYCHQATNCNALPCPRCQTTLSTKLTLNRHLFYVHKVKRSDRVEPLPIAEVAPGPPGVASVVEDTADLSAPPLVSLGNEVSQSTAEVWDVEHDPTQPADFDDRANRWCSGLRQKGPKPRDVGALVGNALALLSVRRSTYSTSQKPRQSTKQEGGIDSCLVNHTDLRRPSIANPHADDITKATYEHLRSLNSIALWDQQPSKSHFRHRDPPWENRQLADTRCPTANFE
jgi:hypothetical protein